MNRAGRGWAPWHERTVLLIGLELAGQSVYLAPYALVLAQPCAWFLAHLRLQRHALDLLEHGEQGARLGALRSVCT